MNPAPANLLVAALGAIAWILICILVWRRARARQRAAAALDAAGSGGSGAPVLVAHASQTGMAENLALQTASALQTAGRTVRVMSFARLDTAVLLASSEVLFIVSTYGEGDPPDVAADFVGTAMQDERIDLAALRYGLLVLGDRTYRNYCGFGRRLDAWLGERGACAMFERIEVDNGDPDAIHAWWRELSHIAATGDLPQWQDVPFEPWVLRERRLLNPGSVGGPVYHLELVTDGATAGWQSGDLLQIRIPADPDRPRDYSIASIPADGAVHLLVRLERREDGSTGLGSGWLTQQAEPGAVVEARLRAHSQFRLEGNAGRDLILIGNGTGLAGLRAHLKQRAHEQVQGGAPLRNWLIFGERQAAHDALYASELADWQASGLLTRLDLVYSRDGHAERYVQDRLKSRAAELRAWVEAGAAIYVCGSLAGMAEGVAMVLRTELGEAVLARLSQEGRYRRDVY